MLVVGGVFELIPIRTPLIPALPMAILLCAVAIAVEGNSITTRSGEVNLSTLGVTDSRVLNSICTLSAWRITLTCSSLLLALFASTGTGFDDTLFAGFASAEATGLEAAFDFVTGITAGFTAGAGAPGEGLLAVETPGVA